MNKYARVSEGLQNQVTVTLTKKLEYFIMLQRHLFPDAIGLSDVYYNL
jgi:hypothetical protein